MLSILRLPVARRLFLASCVARLPMGATSLLLVLFTHELTGSYASAGLAAAVYVIGLGISAPALGRMLDRGHARVVIVGGGIVSATALSCEALVPDGALAPAAVVMAAGIAGLANPPLGGRMRALWRDVLPDRSMVSRAFALEASIMEIVYIFGPVVIVGLLGGWSLRSAFVASGLAVGLGSLTFAAAEPDHSPDRTAPKLGIAGALGDPAVRILLAVMVACGLAAGAIEVAVPAMLGDFGDRSLTGLMLGVWGAGSLCGGLVAGHAAEPRDWVRRLMAVVAAWALLHSLVGLAGSVAALSATLFVAGVTIAPTLMASNRLLDDLAPVVARTEAFTWVSTGFIAGVAIGSGVGGVLTEASSPGFAMTVLSLGALPAVGLMAVSRHTALRVTA